METSKKIKLTKIAEEIRLGILEGTYNAGSGHPGGSLSCADIMAYLYFVELNIDPADPKKDDRDRFVLSKGHAAPALYSALSLRGFFPREDLKNLRKIDCHLQGHPDMNKTPGVDISTGSLGIGLSNACGMAIAAKLQNKSYRVYAITGDGELQEGQIWEAAMFASHYKLDNLIVFADANKLQIDGRTADVLSPEPIDKRFEAFGWNVARIDGHDFDQIEAAVEAAKKINGKPSMIVCDTVKGKGVSFMEDKAGWHGVAPKEDEYKAAVAEIMARMEKLDQEV